MKKILAAFFCLMLLVPVLFTHSVAAATTPQPTVTPTPGPVKYVLPYPGILPTHPLYFLKTLRDKIIEALIANPLNKAEFSMLQADKKLNMGVSLKSLDKTKEAKAAFSESLVSRGQALAILEAQVKAGNKIPGHLVEKFMISLDKHGEVLTSAGESTDALVGLRRKATKLLLEVK